MVDGTSIFTQDPEKKHIYAHKEYFRGSDGQLRTRIKTKEEILKLFAEESKVLQKYMKSIYNIHLNLQEVEGFPG